jgi:hypothetical protein
LFDFKAQIILLVSQYQPIDPLVQAAKSIEEGFAKRCSREEEPTVIVGSEEGIDTSSC